MTSQDSDPIPRLCTTPHTHPQLLIYCLESPEHLKAQDLVTKGAENRLG